MKLTPWKEAVLGLWIVACISLYLFDLHPAYPEFLRNFFTAAYLH